MKKLLSIFLLFYGVGFNHALAQRPQLVELAPVEMADINTNIDNSRIVLGTLKAREYGTIAARIAGEITEVKVQLGDIVQKGQLLAKIDDRAYLYQYEVSRSELASAEAELAVTQRRLERQVAEIKRLEQLKGSAAFSAARLENFEIDANIERASIIEKTALTAQKKAEVKLAKLNVDLTQIKAPFAGVILEKFINLGSFVSAGDDGFSLLNQKAFEVESLIANNMINIINIGQIVHLRKISNLSEPKIEFKGKVRAILPQSDQRTQNRKILIDLDGEDSINNINLADGEQIEIIIPTSFNDLALLIPKDALLIEEDKNYVFIVDGADNNIAKKQQIMIGKAYGDRLSIIEGLEKDALLVVKGNERLSDGAKIIINK